MRCSRPALVHEAYVRLIDQKQVKWRNRAHFFGVAAGMMRRILVDHARRRRAEKRGGDWERVTLAGDEAAAERPNRHRCSGPARGARTARGVRSSTGADRRAPLLRRPDDRGNGGSRWHLPGDRRARVDDRQGLAAGGLVAVRLKRFVPQRARAASASRRARSLAFTSSAQLSTTTILDASARASALAPSETAGRRPRRRNWRTRPRAFRTRSPFRASRPLPEQSWRTRLELR